jgi:DNA-binding response OmpR family regulator
MNILIVDDEGDTRAFVHELLASAGHRVTTAGSGVEAILQVEIQSFDLVLLDLMMPGIDGYQFAEFMSSHWNTFETPVVIVSCRTDPESKFLSKIFNCAGYLEKPFGPAELLDVVDRVDRERHRYSSSR